MKHCCLELSGVLLPGRLLCWTHLWRFPPPCLQWTLPYSFCLSRWDFPYPNNKLLIPWKTWRWNSIIVSGNRPRYQRSFMRFIVQHIPRDVRCSSTSDLISKVKIQLITTFINLTAVKLTKGLNNIPMWVEIHSSIKITHCLKASNLFHIPVREKTWYNTFVVTGSSLSWMITNKAWWCFSHQVIDAAAPQ